MHVYAVAARVFCRVAGSVGLAQQSRKAVAATGDGNQTDAHADAECPAFPNKTELLDGLLHVVGHTLGIAQ